MSAYDLQLWLIVSVLGFGFDLQLFGWFGLIFAFISLVADAVLAWNDRR